MSKFENWLLNEEKGNISKIDIFDFDSTLVFMPEASIGKATIERYNVLRRSLGEEEIPSVGQGKYWQQPETLLPPIVPDPAPISMLNHEVAKEFYASSRDPKRLTVVMTGRGPKLEEHVRRILSDYGMHPDRLYLMPEPGRTVDHKKKHLKSLLDEFKHVREIEMWDDRGPARAVLMGNPNENHVKEFKKFFQRLSEQRCFGDRTYELKYKVNEVPPHESTTLGLMQKHPKFGKNPDLKRSKKKHL